MSCCPIDDCNTEICRGVLCYPCDDCKVMDELATKDTHEIIGKLKDISQSDRDADWDALQLAMHVIWYLKSKQDNKEEE